VHKLLSLVENVLAVPGKFDPALELRQGLVERKIAGLQLFDQGLKLFERLLKIR